MTHSCINFERTAVVSFQQIKKWNMRIIFLYSPWCDLTLCSFCLVPPSIVTEPSDRTVVENQQVTFHCNATGNPTPAITWIRDSKTLNQGDTLNFKVNRNHSGKYWCSAQNGLDVTVNASANLNVLCKYQNRVYLYCLSCCPCTPNNVILVLLRWQT